MMTSSGPKAQGKSTMRREMTGSLLGDVRPRHSLEFLTEHEPMAVNCANTKLSHAPRLVGKRLSELRARGLILGE